MTRGVTLIALGSYGYLQWATNMACSIRFHSPDVAIQLIASKSIETTIDRPGLFDYVTVIPEDAYRDGEKLFPAKLKTKLYDYLKFDETIYLDVDGCIIKDITPLFDIKANIASDIQGVYDLSQGEHFEAMKWATPATAWFHFGLKASDKLPAINSSFLFIRKSKEAKAVFDKAYELLMTNPLPIEQHLRSWGRKRKSKNNQPDELYVNVAFAILGIVPEHAGVIHFRTFLETGPYVNIEDIRSGYYGLGLFGELRDNHLSMHSHYNSEMKKAWNEIITKHTGAPFYNKCETLANSKFAIQ